jgi:RHS repeat-associated protein
LHDIDVQDSSSTTSTCKSKDCDISGGLPLAEELDSGGDTIASHYYAADGNGNITLMTTDTGAVEGAWRYSTYGGPITYSGAPTPSTFATRNPFRFSTKYMDHEVETRGGIYYYGYRHYSPELGRWLSRDPIGERGGVNLYAMVGNDAVNWWDVLGLAKEEGKCCVCIVLGTTATPIDLDDSEAAGDADNASDWFFKKVVKKRADGASSLNYGYTWQVQAGWQAIDKKTKEPIASGTHTKSADTTSAFVHNKREDAQRQGESYRKETRDEAIKKCRDETGCE